MNVIILGSGGCDIGNTIVGDILKDGFVLNEYQNEDNPLRKELFTLDEIDMIRKQYGIMDNSIHSTWKS